VSLRPYRQELEVNIDYITPFTQERGGILCLNNCSGIVEYAPDPIGRKVIGLQLNDIEHVNLTWQPHPQRLRNMDVPCGIAGVAMEGEFETDWIYPVGNIDQGSPAYAGPSGMFTNSSAFGVRVGTFTSILQNAPHAVIWRGAGFSRQFIDPCTKQLVWENDPSQAVRLATPGFIRVRLNQTDIMMSQGSNS
jgi:hypothetical protein